MGYSSTDQVRLQQILSGMVDELNWRKAEMITRIRMSWADAVGEMVAQNTAVFGIDDRKLIVAVPSSVWAQQMVFLWPQIQKILNRTLEPPGMEKMQTLIRPHMKKLAHKDIESGPMHYISGLKGSEWTGTLEDLLERVVQRFNNAKQDWVTHHYQLCLKCQSPTLQGYALCSACQFYKGRQNNVSTFGSRHDGKQS